MAAQTSAKVGSRATALLEAGDALSHTASFGEPHETETSFEVGLVRLEIMGRLQPNSMPLLRSQLGAVAGSENRGD
jgi:hypothetical protein